MIHTIQFADICSSATRCCLQRAVFAAWADLRQIKEARAKLACRLHAPKCRHAFHHHVIRKRGKELWQSTAPPHSPCFNYKQLPQHTTSFQLQSPGIKRGREDAHTLVGRPDQLFPPILLVLFPSVGAGLRLPSTWTQAAINLQSQAENDWRGGNRLLKRDVQLDRPSKLLRVLDVILETVPSQVHLRF